MHLEIISFLEFRVSAGLESAMWVFSDKHTSQKRDPARYGIALVFKDHLMSLNSIFSPIVSACV